MTIVAMLAAGCRSVVRGPGSTGKTTDENPSVGGHPVSGDQQLLILEIEYHHPFRMDLFYTLGVHNIGHRVFGFQRGVSRSCLLSLV